MILRQLGKSEVMVTPMAFGAWAIGGWMWGGAEEEDAIKAIQAALCAGITTFDTAPVYGFGKSEELLGRALKDYPRDSYQILTKFGMNWQTEQGEYFFDTTGPAGNQIKMYKWASRQRIVEECEASLKRLKTDYVDLYQIHWPDKTTPIDETFEAVEKLKKDGKIRAAGVCNYSVALVDEALETISLASNQVPYSMINRAIEHDVIPQAIQKELGIICYSPLQRGLLTGKIELGYKFKEGDSRAGNKYFTDENISRANKLLEQIAPIAEEHDVSLAQLVINWTVHQEGISCVLVGARNKEQVDDNAQALSFSLTDKELEAITLAANEFSLAELTTS